MHTHTHTHTHAQAVHDGNGGTFLEGYAASVVYTNVNDLHFAKNQVRMSLP